MRIFNAARGDPMLLDSAQGLEALHDRLTEFLDSAADAVSLAALTNGSPEPYTEFLGGLRLHRHSAGSKLCITSDRWLELSATEAELERFTQLFRGVADGSHRHWYCSPVSLIVEADDWLSKDAR